MPLVVSLSSSIVIGVWRRVGDGRTARSYQVVRPFQAHWSAQPWSRNLIFLYNLLHSILHHHWLARRSNFCFDPLSHHLIFVLSLKTHSLQPCLLTYVKPHWPALATPGLSYFWLFPSSTRKTQPTISASQLAKVLSLHRSICRVEQGFCECKSTWAGMLVF